MNVFDKINNSIEDAEGSIITFVTAVIPWLAPALPAWLTYSHLIEMNIPGLVAAAMAMCVEALGLSAVATAFSAMRHNRAHKAQARKVSLAFPVAAYVFYVAVVITVNVVLSLPLTPLARQYAQVAAIAMLTLISAPAFIIAVSRQDQRQIDKDWQDAVKQRDDPVSKIDNNVNGPSVVSTNIANMTIDEIASRFNVSKRTAYRYRAKARGNHKA